MLGFGFKPQTLNFFFKKPTFHLFTCEFLITKLIGKKNIRVNLLTLFSTHTKVIINVVLEESKRPTLFYE